MKKYIVTTTINPPTLALKKYANMEDWNLIVVGDLKTPHELYSNINCYYMTPEIQESLYPNLSEIIGWNCIQRRSIGIVEAYNRGADVIATVDDDNIPYTFWGETFINQEIVLDYYVPQKHNIFDPLSITKHNHLWHRGYPIEYVPTRFDAEYKGETTRKVLVQADLWDGDPDIDAISRLTYKPCVKFDDITKPYCSNRPGPFNSQNTFLSREVIPNYMLFPHTGRMDDIWASYVLQYYHPESVIYNRASVYQDRNVQDLIVNLQNEMLGYRNTYKMINDIENYTTYLPEQAKGFEKIYKSSLR